MSDDTALFDRALQQSLNGDTFDSLMEKVRDGVQRGDLERVRVLTAMLDLAVQLGNNAIVAEWTMRTRI